MNLLAQLVMHQKKRRGPQTMGPSPEQAAAPHTAAAMAAAEGLNPDRGRRGGDPYEKPEAYHAREVNRRYHGRGDAARQARA